MLRAVAALVLMTLPAAGAGDDGVLRSLTLPGPSRPGGDAMLEVTVGPLGPGERIRVTSPTGELIGTIAPFGIAARRAGATYTLPLIPGLVRDGALSVCVDLVEQDGHPRPPTPDEVNRLTLVAPPPSR